MLVLLTLAAGQFLMTLDSSPMNVSRRPAAYGLVAAASAVAVAVVPMIGGFCTTLRRNARRVAESRFLHRRPCRTGRRFVSKSACSPR
jgi:hypothetical protein